MAITAEEQKIIDEINSSGSGVMGRFKESRAYDSLSPEAQAQVDLSKIGGIKGRNREDEDALSNIRERVVGTIELGGADPSANAGIIKDVEDRDYTSAQDAGSYIKQLQKTLGVKGPESIKSEMLADADRKMDTAAHRQAVLDASGLASRGLTNSGTAAALESQRGINLAGQKAGYAVDVAQSEADRMDAYRRELMGAAQANAAQQAQFGLSADAQQQAQQRAQFDAASTVTDQQYRNIMAQYQNQLDQLQQANTTDMLTLQQNQAERDKNSALISSGIGLAGSLGGAAIGMPRSGGE